MKLAKRARRENRLEQRLLNDGPSYVTRSGRPVRPARHLVDCNTVMSCNVTKLVSRVDALKETGSKQALEKEMKNMSRFEAWDPPIPSSVARATPDGMFVRAHVIYGIKHAHLPP